MKTVLILPYPPSVNTLFPGKEHRFKSKKYSAWITEAGYATLGNYHQYTVPVKVLYELSRPDNRRRDLANTEKALGDFLVSRGILKDDSLIHDFRMVWVEGITIFDKAGVRITIDQI